MRARSLRLLRTRRTFCSSPPLTRRFNSAISSRSFVLWAVNSEVDNLRISTIFILCLLPFQEFGLNWQLVGGQAHCFASNLFGHTLHLEHNRARLDLGDEEFGVTLTATHLNVEWLAGNRRVRED